MILSHFLSHGECFALPASRSDSTDAIHLVVGAGRGCVFEASSAVAGLWIPLRGRLQLSASSGDVLMQGELASTEAEPNLRVVGRGNALWVALLGNRRAWHRTLGRLSEIPLPDPLWLPARHNADIPLRRRVVALTRAAAKGKPETVFDALIESVLERQNEFAPCIERCPGRTYAQRRQIFLRLQRVRNYVAANCHLDLDNDELARIANYSPWQFIRAFRSAYEQTPHAFLVDQRLQRAQRLLQSSSLAISEIAAATGFQDRCAFSRLFSERFGVTARAFRQESGYRATRLVA